MRELKFRVWNGHSMEHNVTVGKFGNFYVNPENGNGLNPNDSASLTNNTTKYHESTPVMQYTGLKDKNGREIYEGDLVKCLGAISGKSAKDAKEMIGKIVQDSFGWTVVLLHKKEWWAYGSMNYSSFEIIGNIYENPELLTLT